MSQKLRQENALMKRAGRASLLVAMTLIAMKLATFLMTGSVAILSTLFDSAQDLMTSGVNMVAIHHAVEPADDKHRFGHGKAQALGSLIQSFIIAGASLFLLIESIRRFCEPKALTHIGVGILITVIAIIMTAALVYFQTFVIHKTGSLSIKADRAHYSGDILMNIGVIASMLLSYYMGWMRVDAIFGVCVSFYLFFVVYQIVKEAFQMLMDTEMPGSFRREIKELAYSFPEVTGVYGLKTRQSGSNAFVQFCVQLKNTMTLQDVHEITDQIEKKIQDRFPETEVIIHPEPERKHP